MTVRREIAKLRRESGAWRPEALKRTHAVRRGIKGRARQTKLARAAAFNHLAAERRFAFDFEAGCVAAADRRLQ